MSCGVLSIYHTTISLMYDFFLDLPREIAIHVYRLSIQQCEHAVLLPLVCRAYRDFVNEVWCDEKIAASMLLVGAHRGTRLSRQGVSSHPPPTTNYQDPLLYPVASGPLAWYLSRETTTTRQRPSDGLPSDKPLNHTRTLMMSGELARVQSTLWRMLTVLDSTLSLQGAPLAADHNYQYFCYNPDTRTDEYSTPAHFYIYFWTWAIQRNSALLLRIMLARFYIYRHMGSSIGIPELLEYGIILAAGIGNERALGFLLVESYYPTNYSSHQLQILNHAMDRAIINDRASAAMLLLEYGADRYHCMYEAASRNRVAILRMVLRGPTIINRMLLNNLLHSSTMMGCPDAVELILDHGADPYSIPPQRMAMYVATYVMQNLLNADSSWDARTGDQDRDRDRAAVIIHHRQVYLRYVFAFLHVLAWTKSFLYALLP